MMHVDVDVHGHGLHRYEFVPSRECILLLNIYPLTGRA